MNHPTRMRKYAKLSALSTHDKYRIALEALCYVRTVDNVLKGRASASVTKRVRDAAERLGIEFPHIGCAA